MPQISHEKVKDEICITRSARGSEQEVVNHLEQLIDVGRLTVISGDMNICLDKDPQSLLPTVLGELGFQQLVTSPTHMAGGRIDHVYLNDPGSLLGGYHLTHHTPYYSDHDALCLSMTLQV